MIITNAMIITAVLAFIALRVVLYLIARPENLGKVLTEHMPDRHLARQAVDISVATRMKMRLCAYVVAVCAAILIALFISTAGGDTLLANKESYNYELTFRALIAISVLCLFYLIALLGKLKTANELLDFLERENGVSIDNLLGERIEDNQPQNKGKH